MSDLDIQLRTYHPQHADMVNNPVRVAWRRPQREGRKLQVALRTKAASSRCHHQSNSKEEAPLASCRLRPQPRHLPPRFLLSSPLPFTSPAIPAVPAVPVFPYRFCCPYRLYRCRRCRPARANFPPPPPPLSILWASSPRASSGYNRNVELAFLTRRGPSRPFLPVAPQEFLAWRESESCNRRCATC
eukprot:755358-Hanusia_phi.AAC.3